jgi:hypothetical protein
MLRINGFSTKIIEAYLSKYQIMSKENMKKYLFCFSFWLPWLMIKKQ